VGEREEEERKEKKRKREGEKRNIYTYRRELAVGPTPRAAFDIWRCMSCSSSDIYNIDRLMYIHTYIDIHNGREGSGGEKERKREREGEKRHM
jgi:hypothetical protein